MKRIFLITLLASPFLIKAMDAPAYVVPESIVTHKEKVLTLCTATHSMLQKFRDKHEKRIAALVAVVDQMSALKLTKPSVEPRDIGLFIYEKKPNDFKSVFNTNQNHILAAVFFERLRRYYIDLFSGEQNVAPNVLHINNYLHKLEIERILTKNSERNIMIPENTINEIIMPAPASVDVEKFKTFMDDIEDILEDQREDIELTFQLIYHNELKRKTSNELSRSCLS